MSATLADKQSTAIVTRWTYAAIAFAFVYPTLLAYAYFVWSAGHSGGVQQAIYIAGKLIQFGFPIAWVVLVERRRPRLSPPDRRGLGMGIAFGAAVFAATVLLYTIVLRDSPRFVGPRAIISEKVLGFGLSHLWQYVALGVFYSLCHSFLEEYYWRWFVFGQMRRVMSRGKAILWSSLGFMAHHVVVLGWYFGWLSPETIVLSISVAVGGVFWAWLYDRSNSLYAPWISHLLVDAGIFAVGYDVLAGIYSSVAS